MILSFFSAKGKSQGWSAFLFLLFSLFLTAAYAQPKPKVPAPEKKLIQLSGVITTTDRLPAPYTTVRIQNSIHGTIAGVDGFYSLVVGERDTVEYFALGLKKLTYIVPAGQASDQKLTHNVELKRDTITFDVTTVYPWPTKEEFREAFLNLKLDDNAGDLARKNLDQKKLAELYETLARDGKENQIYALQQIATSYYYAGGQKNYMLTGGMPVPTSLLNPFAWAEFIKAIQEGKYKKKKE